MPLPLQMAVLAGLTFPIVACTYSVAPITGADSVVCLVWLLLFVGESVTDNQQRAFQREKYRRIAAKESLQGDYSRGFRCGSRRGSC